MFLRVVPLSKRFLILQGLILVKFGDVKLPSQTSKLGLGTSQRIIPWNSFKYFSYKVLTDNSRSFKFVSPSRFIVETKTMSFGAWINKRSAGTS